MRPSILCIIVLLSCVLAVSSVSPIAERSFFQGRSGDILIASENQADGSLYLHNVAAPFNDDKLADSSVAELISHLLGTTPLSPAVDRSAFPQIDLFKRPKANLLITIDATETGFETLASGKKIRVIPTAISKDSISTLTTIATGASPSAHGIVGRAWLNAAGRREEAYIGNAQPVIVNFADILSQSFGGHSLTVSISADQQMTAALAAHASTFRNKPTANNFAYFWNQRTESVDSFSFFGRFERDLVLTKANIEEILMKVFEDITIKEQIVSVKGSPVTFNLAEQEDFQFFAELAMIANFGKELAANEVFSALVADSTPDFFAVALSTLKGIKAKYTVSSQQYAVAARLADSVLSSFILSFEEAYSKEGAIEVVFLGTPAAPLPSDVVSTTNIVLERDLISEKVDEEFLPNVYLKNFLTPAQRSSDCASLTRSLADFAVKVYCADKARVARDLLDNDDDCPFAGEGGCEDEADASGSGSSTASGSGSAGSASGSGSGSGSASDSGSGSGYVPPKNGTFVQLSQDGLTSFQIIFLMFFVLIAAVIAAVCAVCSIGDSGKDTILVHHAPSKK